MNIISVEYQGETRQAIQLDNPWHDVIVLPRAEVMAAIARWQPGDPLVVLNP